MSVSSCAGAAQFAAVGYVVAGVSWPAIVLLTALLNARHLLYSAAVAAVLRGVPIWRRAVPAQLLTDETFALAIGHFRRLGWPDEWGYWLGAIAPAFLPGDPAAVGREPRGVGSLGPRP